jgi:N-acetylneuraminic acid mutarotase
MVSTNNLATGSVTVQVRDVACQRLLAPAGTVDSGMTVTPVCSVANPGSTTETYQVRMKVGAFYNQTAVVTSHAPGTTIRVTFPEWAVTQLGTHAVVCSTELSGDLVPANNRQSGSVTVLRPPVHDVGCVRVVAPAGQVDSGTSVVPACTLHNYGNSTETYNVRMKVSAAYNQTTPVTSHAAGVRLYVTFPAWSAAARGSYAVTCSTELAIDSRADNDRASGQVDVRVLDVELGAVIVPAGSVVAGTTVTPQVRLHNNGTGSVSFAVRLVLTGTTTTYDTTETGVTLSAGETRDHLFTKVWTAGPVGSYTTLARAALNGDMVPANDSARNSFTVIPAGGPAGWVEKASMPLLPSSKQAKDGGWLTEDGRYVYAAKGNKTPDFYRYDTETDSWQTLAPIPDGREGRKPGRGAVGAAGGNYVYAVKGNNTQGFWRYAPGQDSWQQMADIPLGMSNRKVKGGTDMVYVGNLGQYPDRLYLLKGGRNEFWLYDIDRDSWRETSEAPIGVGGKIKYDKGSWLTYAPAAVVTSEFGIVYCHKAKYHELYAFEPVTDTWFSRQLNGMPFNGSSGKKKSKDGGCAAWLDGLIYALKGGNTAEFWSYVPEQDSWTEREPMPELGSTGKAKKVKAGADLAAVQNVLFALKGNKTREMWRYGPAQAQAHARAGVRALSLGIGNSSLLVPLNPLRTGLATVRLSGSAAQWPGGPVRIDVHDVTGRLVVTRTCSLQSEFGVSLPAGVYLVRLAGPAGAATTRLTVVK